MWGWGPDTHGYCGETAFQSSGAYFGNYISQERVRYAAGNEELLIGEHDERVAKTLKLTYEQFDESEKGVAESEMFVRWAGEKISEGAPVILGFFQHVEDLEDGHDGYDHIMIMVGAGGIGAESSRVVYYNDFARKTTRALDEDKDLFKGTRKQCVCEDEPEDPEDFTYSIPKPEVDAIAITGIMDKHRETKRMMLHIPSWKEPDWGDEDELEEDPVKLHLSATIFGLTPGGVYAVVRFDDPKVVPTSSFLESDAWSRLFIFEAAHENVFLSEFDHVMSDGAYFYRAVEMHRAFQPRPDVDAKEL
jgi:hypothetical protein